MELAADEDPVMKDRYNFYLLREIEELYDWSTDPGSRKNLAGDPEYADVLKASRKGLHQWMLSSGDPLADTYRKLGE